MGSREKLFWLRNPYQYAESAECFLAAMRDNCRYQYRHCEEYAALLDAMDFSPEELTSENSLARLPVLPTLLFKRHRLSSMPRWRVPVEATSSGTGGAFSQIGFDAAGLLCGLNMVLQLGRRHGLFSAKPAYYILLGYQPHKGNHTAVTKTAFGATLFAPALHRTYALRYDENGYKADLDGVIRAVINAAKGHFPVRFMGFPSYTFFMLSQMAERGIRLKLPKDSKIMMAGGWKQFYTQQVDKTVLYTLAQQVLGVSQDAITEFFGAVEHPVMYTSCPNHHFHVPTYSRVIIRDPDTLQPLKYGQTGLVNLLTPMVYAAPILSVMTDDLGILHPAEECACGINAPYMEIIGRIGLHDIKTCAAGAAALLRNTEL